jgi:hypothetical protein
LVEAELDTAPVFSRGDRRAAVPQGIEASDRAVDEVAVMARRLLATLATTADSQSRETEAARARARNAERFGRGV